jgi:hypothetical protein
VSKQPFIISRPIVTNQPKAQEPKPSVQAAAKKQEEDEEEYYDEEDDSQV